MSELVTPNPLLVEYYIKAQQLTAELIKDVSYHKSQHQWHYIESNIEYNIFLLQRLKDLDLLPNDVKICDCGIGLATIMYDFYLQSKDIVGHRFSFWGVESYQPYVDAFESELRSYWNGDLNLIKDDLMAHNYSRYNFIWIFTPYSRSDKLMQFFEKVISEMPRGGIVFGIDHYRIMTYGSDKLKEMFMELVPTKLDELWVFKKG